MKTNYYINVNRKKIASNKKNKSKDPPISVRRGRAGKSSYANKIPIKDKEGNTVAWVEYSPDQPLSCGAQVFVTCLYPTDVQQEVGCDC